MFITFDPSIVFIFLIFLCFTVNEGSKRCHSLDINPKNYLGTKTPYSHVANNNDDPIVYEGCTPLRIWAIIRHGTRNPGKIADKMRVNLSALKMIIIGHHESGKGTLCPEVVDDLGSWEPTVDPSELKYLVHEGEEEMLLLGERFLNRWPALLPELYSNKTYKFRHTATQRTKESAQYFTTGLFGRRQKAHVWYPEPLAKDPILRFYKLCTKWQLGVDKNASALAEVEKFKSKPQVTKMLEGISARIGLTNAIKFDDAKLIYQACGFETAWHPKIPSPWCGILSGSDLKILEYAEDLKYFWNDGYGYPITYEQACVAISDMFRHFRQDNFPPYTFYFTHSGTLLKVLSHLGLYKDPEPLLAEHLDTSRLWRTSKIDAFGSNLAFVLYKCRDDEDLRVLTLHQERPVTLPGCPKGELCPMETLLDTFSQTLHDCNFNKMCEVHDEL